jgi:hypothetical protein
MALAAGCAVLLGGCNTSPGAAALVGGDRITDTQVDSAVSAALSNPAFAGTVNGQRAKLARHELGSLIILQLLRAQAAALHVSVTPAEIQHAIDTNVQQAGSQAALDQELAQNGLAPSDFRTNIEENLLLTAIVSRQTHTSSPSSSQLQSAAYKVLVDETKQLGVHVDPRYGRWVPTTAQVVPVDNGLSSPASTNG